MKPVFVLYQSKYGATKKYVDMLAARLPCDCMEANSFRGNSLDAYDWIVYAAGIYASGISGLKRFLQKCAGLDHRKIVVFCVGASPYEEKALSEIKAHNLKAEWSDIPVFYGRGAWEESRMSWKDRTLCKMLQKAVAKQDPASFEPWMKALLEAAGQSCDWTDPGYLAPLLRHIQADRYSVPPAGGETHV